MGKKKKFGFSDALEIAQGAADVYAAFNSGNSTNLKGAQGGASKPKPKTPGGTSQLNLDEIDRYRKS